VIDPLLEIKITRLRAKKIAENIRHMPICAKNRQKVQNESAPSACAAVREVNLS